ncbi:MAG: tetratricopeptide repeat protein [Planctomycetota bacterium]|jgi:hypothetical protein
MRSVRKFYKRPTFITVVTVLLLAAFAVPTTLALTSKTSDKKRSIKEAQKLSREASWLMKDGDFGKTRDLLEQAVALDPAFAEAWVGLGMVYLKLGDSAKARDAYEKGFSLHEHNYKEDPNDANQLIQQIGVLLLLGRDSQAKKLVAEGSLKHRGDSQFDIIATTDFFNDFKGENPYILAENASENKTEVQEMNAHEVLDHFIGAAKVEYPEAVLRKERDRLLGEIGAEIRKGIIELSQRFPQLAKSSDWTRFLAETSGQGRIEIGLRHIYGSKSGNSSKPVLENDRYSVLVVIKPPPPQTEQIAMFPLYPNLGLVGQVGTSAGNPDLDTSLKKLVDDALLPLKQLDVVAKVINSLADGLTGIAAKYPELVEYSIDTVREFSKRWWGLLYSHNFSRLRSKRSIRESDFGEKGFYISFKCKPMSEPGVLPYAMPPPTLTIRNLRLYLWTDVKTASDPSPGLVNEVQLLFDTHTKMLKELDGVTNRESDDSVCGRESGGLQCRVWAPMEIEQGMSLEVKFELRSFPENLETGTKQLNMFLRDAHLKLSLKNVKTNKVFTIEPYDPTSGMPVTDRATSVVPLGGSAVEPWKVSFPLVRERDALDPGLYECSVEYSLPKEPDWRWDKRNGDWESFGFWHGTITSPPFELTILKETPKTKRLLLPKRLHYSRQERIVNYTKQDAIEVEVPVRNGYFIGTRISHGRGYGTSGAPLAPDGINGIDNTVIVPPDGKLSYTIEIFETADPPKHMWRPHSGSGNYKTLWKETFEVDVSESSDNSP